MLDVKELNYTINKDIEFILEAESINIDTLSSLTNISRSTIYEILKNKKTTDSVYEKFYSFVYNKKYRLNSVKEDLQKESAKDMMILFHGSKFGLLEITIDGARNNCDFGNGFYLGESYNNALSFVCENEKSSVYSFSCDLKGLTIVRFDCSLEWMLAICYYRGYINKYNYSQIIKDIIEKTQEADVIIAPIADNKMFYIMYSFANGDINADVALHSLSASKLGLQYVFKTEKSLQFLKPIEKYYLCNDEKKDCQNILKQRSSEIETKLKLTKREYKTGLFIEELLDERI